MIFIHCGDKIVAQTIQVNRFVTVVDKLIKGPIVDIQSLSGSDPKDAVVIHIQGINTVADKAIWYKRVVKETREALGGFGVTI
jgi:hypothetical protein